MIPWTLLDSALIPGGTAELRLMRRGQEFSIRLGEHELMNNRLSGSEEALATLAWDRIRGRRQATMLIGGLGMGFTLRAALICAAADARIVVSELVPAVVAWAHGPLAELFAGSLSDPRVTLREVDVAAVIRERAAAFDAILLDVDNGPEALTLAANDGLYAPAGLGIAYRALRPGGVLAVWSSGPSRAFAARLGRAGFAVVEHRVRARRGGKGASHVIWIATRPLRGSSARPALPLGAARDKPQR